MATLRVEWLEPLHERSELDESCLCQTGRFPKWPWRTLGGLCGVVACASLADVCTGPRWSSSFAHHGRAGVEHVLRTVSSLRLEVLDERT